MATEFKSGTTFYVPTVFKKPQPEAKQPPADPYAQFPAYTGPRRCISCGASESKRCDH